LFLGGWNTGIPPLDDALYTARNASGSDGSAIVGYLANVLGLLVFVSKAFVGVFVQIWLRWTLPRLRIDQVMTTCLKYLVPISCFLFLGATLWPLLLATAAQRSTWTPQPLGARAAAELRESTAAASAPVSEMPVSAVPAVQAQLDARPEGAIQ
jgi:NADH-quinone oxidoreductase subunit H